MTETSRLAANELWQHVVKNSARALQSKHLQPIPTRCDCIRDGDVDWLVRIAARPSHDHPPHPPHESPYRASHNPFLPYEPAMYVSDLSSTHVCLLNKYNVVPHHVLIVTRQYEDQESPLDRADFDALWVCVEACDALGFYNAGPQAGASQSHKHLQAIPLPLHDGCAHPVPLEPLYELTGIPAGTIHRSRRLPFVHCLARLDPRWVRQPHAAAAATHQLYRDMIAAIGWQDVSAATPYNLLLTRNWMLLVPRRTEYFQQISLNAMAFAGAFFVKDQPQAEHLLRDGPLLALTHVAIRD